MVGQSDHHFAAMPRHFLTQYWRRLLSTASCLPLLYLAHRLDHWTFKAALALSALICLWGWTRDWRRYRTIDSTPTSRIASAAQGYVELFGRGRSDGQPTHSPLTGLPCLWYRVERLGKTRQAQVIELGKPAHRNQYYQLLHQGYGWRKSRSQSDDAFLLEDGSGSVRIDPARAEILTSRYSEHVRDGYRYGEWLLLEHDQLYVLGELTSVRASEQAPDMRTEVANRLAEWKADPAALLARYDRDGNGEISPEEWEAARADASREVAAERRQQAVLPALHTLRRPRDGRPFLIANQPPEQLARRHRLWAWLQLALALGALAGLLWISLLPPRPAAVHIEFETQTLDDE